MGGTRSGAAMLPCRAALAANRKAGGGILAHPEEIVLVKQTEQIYQDKQIANSRAK